MQLLEQANERVNDEARDRFVAGVEAARIGTAAAWNKRAESSWRSARSRTTSRATHRRQRGLSGAALEQAVMQLRQMDPGMVALPGETPRRIRRKR